MRGRTLRADYAAPYRQRRRQLRPFQHAELREVGLRHSFRKLEHLRGNGNSGNLGGFSVHSGLFWRVFAGFGRSQADSGTFGWICADVGGLCGIYSEFGGFTAEMQQRTLGGCLRQNWLAPAANFSALSRSVGHQGHSQSCSSCLRMYPYLYVYLHRGFPIYPVHTPCPTPIYHINVTYTPPEHPLDIS
jgi:hypothetical protein